MEKRIRTKDLIQEIELIRVKTHDLKQIVEALPVSPVKKAFEYSVTNLETKIERYTKITERMVLSDEEKVLISKFRAEKAEAQFRAEKTEAQIHEVSAVENVTAIFEKPKKKK